MCFDSDIKIAGDKPSRDIKRARNQNGDMLDAASLQRAKEIGRSVALRFIEDSLVGGDEGFRDYELLVQRRLLLSFTATICFEQYIESDALAGIAQKSFLDTIKSQSDDLYKTSSDTGAFSFYYLAYRRGGEIDRRIGQTFAMLCSHDGDPIFQELGEALYCWFSSVVRDAVAVQK